jgi:hypothetical protein
MPVAGVGTRSLPRVSVTEHENSDGAELSADRVDSRQQRRKGATKAKQKAKAKNKHKDEQE